MPADADIELAIRGYAGMPRDSRFEDRAVAWLRGQPEQLAGSLIEDVLRRNVMVGQSWLRRVGLRRERLSALLAQQLVHSDASAVRYWIEAITPKLGVARTLHLVAQSANGKPEVARKLAYWLHLIKPHTVRERSRFQEVRERLAKP